MKNEYPYVVRGEIKDILKQLHKHFHLNFTMPEDIPFDMSEDIIVHAYKSKSEKILKTLKSKSFLSMIESKPLLVIIPSGRKSKKQKMIKNKYTAYAKVPEELQDTIFNAELWLKSIVGDSTEITTSSNYLKASFESENIDDLLSSARLFAQQLK